MIRGSYLTVAYFRADFRYKNWLLTKIRKKQYIFFQINIVRRFKVVGSHASKPSSTFRVFEATGQNIKKGNFNFGRYNLWSVILDSKPFYSFQSHVFYKPNEFSLLTFQEFLKTYVDVSILNGSHWEIYSP